MIELNKLKSVPMIISNHFMVPKLQLRKCILIRTSTNQHNKNQLCKKNCQEKSLVKE